MKSITPFLWFNDQAEEAMHFYVATFPNSHIKEVARYGDAGPGPKGSVMTARFEINGQEFVALNGGPQFPFTEAVSFLVSCENQDEVDRYWNRLTSDGGSPSQCGWLKDKFGLSWQIVPTALTKLLGDPDRDKANRVMRAMLTMSRIDIAALERAHAG